MHELMQNIRYAARTLKRSPLFAFTAILSLALGIGANTAVFSFVRAVTLKRLPVSGADRLVVVRQHNETFHMENCCFTYRFFRELRQQKLGFSDIFAASPIEINFTDRDETERLQGELVSGNYFRMLGVRAVAGRVIDEADDLTEGSGAVCVISYRLWQERYGAKPDAIGRQVLVNNQPYRIIGVSQPGFTGVALHAPHDIQIPTSMAIQIFNSKRDSFGWAQLIARLNPGIAMQQGQERLNAVGLRLQRAAGWRFTDRDVFSLKDGSQGLNSKKDELGKPVIVLMMLVSAVLLIACTNLSALLMVRSVERAKEAGVRVALGASRSTLMRRFLTESLVLAAAGGVCGIFVAFACTQALLGLLGKDSEGLAALVRPDWAVFAFCAAITMVTGLLFGVLPAWRSSQVTPLDAIRGVGASQGGRLMWSRILMASQIALSLALLFGAGLFERTLRNLRGIDLGFRPENVVLMQIDLSNTTHAGKRSGPFFEELLGRAREIPGVRAASFASISALSGAMASVVLNVQGYSASPGVPPVSYFTSVSNGYFRTLGIPILEGRDFIASDRGTGEGAVVVNRQFAQRYLGGNALGKTFSYGGGRKVHVVGVAGVAKFRYLREEPQPVMYLPVTQWTYPESLYLQVRTADGDSAVGERLRAMMREMDRRVPIDSVTTMALQIDQALARERLLAFLSSLMGGLAATLAAIGLYGVLSFSVARRTREI